MIIISEETAENISSFCNNWNSKTFESIEDLKTDLQEMVEQVSQEKEYLIIGAEELVKSLES
jgi:hypothetical protein